MGFYFFSIALGEGAVPPTTRRIGRQRLGWVSCSAQFLQEEKGSTQGQPFVT